VATSGLKFTTTGYTLSGTGSDSVTVAGAMEVDTGVTATISGKITGSNSFAKTSAGTLVLSGSNDFVGNASVSAGTLSISSDANLGATTNDLTLGGTLATTPTISLNAGRDLSGSGTLDIAGGTSLTTNGTFTVGSLNLANSGDLSLQGAPNTLSTLTTTAGGTISGNTLTLGGNVTTGASANTATLSVSTLALGAAARTFNIADGSATSDLTISSAITSSGSGTLIKTGAGTLTLSGSNSGLAATTGVRLGIQGTTPVEGGTLAIANGNAFGGSSSVAFQFNSGTLSAGSALTLPNSISLGGRSNNGVSTPTFTGADLTISGTPSFFRATGTTGTLPVVVNNHTTLSGNFAATGGSGTSTTGIVLGGTGTLTLKGTNTALVDPLTVASALTVNIAPTTSSLDGLGTGALTIASGATVAIGSGGAIGNTVANAGTLTFASASTYTWGLTLLSTTGAGTNFDQITNTGLVSLTSLATLTPAITPSLAPGTDASGFWATNHTWTIVASSGGTITGTALTATNAYGSYGTFATAFNGSNLDLTWTASAIPEPSTYAAIFGAIALAGAFWHRRRRQRPAA